MIDWSTEWITLLASICELIGIYLLGKKNKLGFISNILGDILWIIYTLVTGNAIGIMLVCTIALILNTKGYRKWKR